MIMLLTGIDIVICFVADQDLNILSTKMMDSGARVTTQNLPTNFGGWNFPRGPRIKPKTLCVREEEGQKQVWNCHRGSGACVFSCISLLLSVLAKSVNELLPMSYSKYYQSCRYPCCSK